MVDHYIAPPSTCICKTPKPERQGLIVDRGRRTTMVHCEGCGEKWDRPDGANEFDFWAMGFGAGKRATILQASETADPEMGAWSMLYGEPDDQEQEVMGESPMTVESTPGVAVESPLVVRQGPDLVIHNSSATVHTPLVIESLRPGNPRHGAVGWPEWFLPLMKLRGFTFGGHRNAIDDIATGCKASGITPELVVANFVAWWMPRRDQARWECPVAGLWDELGHHINEVVKAPPHRRAAVLELAAASVGLEYGCRYCGEGGFIYQVSDDQRVRWPVICNHRPLDPEGPPHAWEPRGWDSVLELLRSCLSASVYTSWVMDLELIGFDAQVALVKCHNRTHATWVYRQIIETLRSTLEAEIGRGEGDAGLEMMMVWESGNARRK